MDAGTSMRPHAQVGKGTRYGLPTIFKSQSKGYQVSISYGSQASRWEILAWAVLGHSDAVQPQQRTHSHQTICWQWHGFWPEYVHHDRMPCTF